MQDIKVEGRRGTMDDFGVIWLRRHGGHVDALLSHQNRLISSSRTWLLWGFAKRGAVHFYIHPVSTNNTTWANGIHNSLPIERWNAVLLLKCVIHFTLNIHIIILYENRNMGIYSTLHIKHVFSKGTHHKQMQLSRPYIIIERIPWKHVENAPLPLSVICVLAACRCTKCNSVNRMHVLQDFSYF